MNKKQLDCFLYPAISNEEHSAIKALHKGEADAYQQALALKVIVSKFSRAHDLLYFPDSFDQTAFINGRAFVGQQVLLLLKIPIGKINHKQEEEKDEKEK